MLNSIVHNDSRVAVPQTGPCSANKVIPSADIYAKSIAHFINTLSLNTEQYRSAACLVISASSAKFVTPHEQLSPHEASF